jgi:hypothetical protein
MPAKIFWRAIGRNAFPKGFCALFYHLVDLNKEVGFVLHCVAWGQIQDV